MTQNQSAGSGHSVFQDTMADMTFPELGRAAKAGAVALWGLGVIEQHGPHLPLATDVYVPSAILQRARRLLSQHGIESVIVPPFYWGVNHVTRSFTGSFIVRPAVMIELMKDVFASLKKDGFTKVFCLSGHGDALHNQTILEGVRQGSQAAAIEGRIVVSQAALGRFGFDPADPHLAIATGTPPARGKYVDVHAGDWETSLVWAICPEVVRRDVLPRLEPTNLGPSDLAEWRKGDVHAQRTTPLGYFGDPAAANRERGETLLEQEAEVVATAIGAALQRLRQP
jgi:creatinine amidohydrolase